MKILFLDQSGDPGGAELALLDIASLYKDSCLIGLFTDGSFRNLLEQKRLQVEILMSQSIKVRKDSGLLRSIAGLWQLFPLIVRVALLSLDYELVYANTLKALVVAAIASLLNRRPLVYHLHDILSKEHFSWINRRLAVFLINRFVDVAIANSKATQQAFVAEGGIETKTTVIYNGFEPKLYLNPQPNSDRIRKELGLEGKYVVGHFSRLGPWKGQHVLIEALSHCPEHVTAIFVGGAFFNVEEYVRQLHQQVKELGLSDRIRFLGFRNDIPELMAACDLIAHTSIAPEPFGRVIVEAMLSEKPVVAAGAGGAVELVKHGQTGWLTPPGNALKLSEIINLCRDRPEQTRAIASSARIDAMQRFDLSVTNQQITQLIKSLNMNCKTQDSY
jgi:glycosyltransferase involved in cell wall biosynthesis